MVQIEVAIIDKGYALVDGDMPLPEIWGLDNREDQRFYHLGCVYPTGKIVSEVPGVSVVVDGVE